MTMNYNVLLSQIHIHIVNRHRWVCTTLVCPSANRVLQKKTAGHLNACLPTMQRGNGKGGGGGVGGTVRGRDVGNATGPSTALVHKQWTLVSKKSHAEARGH